MSGFSWLLIPPKKKKYTAEEICNKRERVVMLEREEAEYTSTANLRAGEAPINSASQKTRMQEIKKLKSEIQKAYKTDKSLEGKVIQEQHSRILKKEGDKLLEMLKDPVFIRDYNKFCAELFKVFRLGYTNPQQAAAVRGGSKYEALKTWGLFGSPAEERDPSFPIGALKIHDLITITFDLETRSFAPGAKTFQQHGLDTNASTSDVSYKKYEQSLRNYVNAIIGVKPPDEIKSLLDIVLKNEQNILSRFKSIILACGNYNTEEPAHKEAIDGLIVLVGRMVKVIEASIANREAKLAFLAAQVVIEQPPEVKKRKPKKPQGQKNLWRRDTI